MLSIWRRVIVAAALFAASIAGAQAERRVALVIGNSTYVGVAPLANPENDSADVAAELVALGFEVILGQNLTVAAFDQKLRDFAAASGSADVALFYYSGHGLQANEQNYLLPVDAQFADLSGMKRQSVALADIVADMQERAKTALVFIDACRDNPLADRLAGTVRSVSRGLARVDVSGRNTLLVFATGPGKVAEDGDGRNSPFTQAFLKNIGSPGVEIESMMKRVTASVIRSTNGKQEPERLSRLTTDFYFVASTPTGEQRPPKTSKSMVDTAKEAFDAAKAIDTIEAYDAFIATYSDTFYAALAKQLKARKLAGANRATPLPPAGASICTWSGTEGVLNSEGYCATSVLAPQGATIYTTANLRSSGPGNAWCEGAKGDGIGETIVFRMDRPMSFDVVAIENGYTKSPILYGKNSRPDLVELKTSDGMTWRTHLEDVMRMQFLALPTPVKASWISLTILSVYSGSKYSDTCISYFRPQIDG
jgi:uncharacterized caspase-like protein